MHLLHYYYSTIELLLGGSSGNAFNPSPVVGTGDAEIPTIDLRFNWSEAVSLRRTSDVAFPSYRSIYEYAYLPCLVADVHRVVCSVSVAGQCYWVV